MKPIEKISLGKLSISVFKKENKISFNLQKSYLNNKKEWVNNNLGIFPEELPVLTKIINKVNNLY